MGLPNCHGLRESITYQPSVKGTHFHYRQLQTQFCFTPTCKFLKLLCVIFHFWILPHCFSFPLTVSLEPVSACSRAHHIFSVQWETQRPHIAIQSPEQSTPALCKALSWIWTRTVVLSLLGWLPLMLATGRLQLRLSERLSPHLGSYLLSVHCELTCKYPLGHGSFRGADGKRQELWGASRDQDTRSGYSEGGSGV